MSAKRSTPLRAARKESQKTLEIVADAVGCEVGHLSNIERGNGLASPALAERLVKFLGVEWLTEIHVLYPDRFLVPAESSDIDHESAIRN